MAKFELVSIEDVRTILAGKESAVNPVHILIDAFLSDAEFPYNTMVYAPIGDWGKNPMGASQSIHDRAKKMRLHIRTDVKTIGGIKRLCITKFETLKELQQFAVGNPALFGDES